MWEAMFLPHFAGCALFRKKEGHATGIATVPGWKSFKAEMSGTWRAEILSMTFLTTTASWCCKNEDGQVFSSYLAKLGESINWGQGSWWGMTDKFKWKSHVNLKKKGKKNLGEWVKIKLIVSASISLFLKACLNPARQSWPGELWKFSIISCPYCLTRWVGISQRILSALLPLWEKWIFYSIEELKL